MALTRDKRNLFFMVAALLAVMAFLQFMSYGLMLGTYDISHKVQKGKLRADGFVKGTWNVTRHKHEWLSSEVDGLGSNFEKSEAVELISQSRESEVEAELLSLGQGIPPPSRCNGALCTFFDITINSSSVGRIVFLLHGKQRPKAVENFRALSTGEKGLSSSGTNLHYKGTIFSRVVHNILVQGGDIHRGTAADEEKESIYGKAFRNEGHDELHERGLLAMAGLGKGGSEFFITLDSVAELDNQYVVFGKVEMGMDVVDQINSVTVNDEGEPVVSVVISDCGEL